MEATTISDVRGRNSGLIVGDRRLAQYTGSTRKKKASGRAELLCRMARQIPPDRRIEDNYAGPTPEVEPSTPEVRGVVLDE